MAYKIKDIYPSQTTTGDAGWPDGKPRNIQGGVQGTGTPFEEKLFQDYEGSRQALFDEAGIEPSGQADRVGQSDFVDALEIKTLITTLKQQGYTYKGKFSEGFIYSSETDVGIDHNSRYYSYIGSEDYPVTVPAGTDPTGDDFRIVTSLLTNSLEYSRVLDTAGDLQSAMMPEGSLTKIKNTGVVYIASFDASNAGNSGVISGDGGVYYVPYENEVNAKSYLHAGVTPRGAILTAASVARELLGATVYVPSEISWDIEPSDVLGFTGEVRLRGDRPSYNPETGDKTGTWINGYLSVFGSFSGVSLVDIGIDSRSSNTKEGVVISNTANLPTIKNIHYDGVTVITSGDANHCFLIENADRVTGGTLEVHGGIQGFAIKAVNFDLDTITAYDQTTWGCTVRYSPGAECRKGKIKSVTCDHIKNTKGGGVICMNNQVGASLEDVTFGEVNIYDGNAGFFITNHDGNTVQAENIKVNHLHVSGVSGYAFQTFGTPKNISVKSAYIEDCGGSFYTNNGEAENIEIINATLQNVTAPALLSGKNHICRGWRKIGSSGSGFFIQNSSIDLQVFDMDQNVSAVANINGGNVLSLSSGATTITSNGNLPAMTLEPNKVISAHFLGVSQNDVNTLFDLNSGSNKHNIRMMVTAQSQAGIHMRQVIISGSDIQHLSSSNNAELVFEIQKTSDSIEIKYLFASSGDFSVNVVADVMQ